MKDFYSERLKELSAKKKERSKRVSLPMGKPEQMQAMNEELITLAGNPNAPQQEEQPKGELQQGMFKNMFDHYNKQPEFKQGMDEFVATMATMREEIKDLNLPPELMEKRVQAMVDQYQKQAMSLKNNSPQIQGGSMEQAVPQQAPQQMPQQPMPGSPALMGGLQ